MILNGYSSHAKGQAALTVMMARCSLHGYAGKISGLDYCMSTSYLLPRLLGLLFITHFLLGCAAIPVQEMSDARQAVEAAEAAGAANLAPDDYQRAVILLRNAEAEWAMGDYDAAHESAAQAKRLALKAQQQAQQKAQE